MRGKLVKVILNFCVVKLVPPQDVGFSGAQNVKMLETLKASSFHFLSVRRCL